MKKIMGYLRLMRPANILTAISDILAGIAIAGYFIASNIEIAPVLYLMLATAGLYGGGVVMNDFFDAELDSKERPERPIPSGLISQQEALILGLTLLMVGILSAFMVYQYNGEITSGLIAITIAAAAIVYDKWSKHLQVIGPLNMGVCRGLNLLLGMSIIPAALEHYYWILAAVPVIYIAAITMISRGEVYGGRKITLLAAAFLYLVVMGCIVYVSFLENTMPYTVIFILIWGILVFPPLGKAIIQPGGKEIGGAVKAGVIALIAMNAAWAAAFSTFYFALVVVILLPLSIVLAKLFAVT